MRCLALCLVALVGPTPWSAAGPQAGQDPGPTTELEQRAEAALPPGVLLLSRVKSRVKTELQRLPNISCLETIDREVQPPKDKSRHMDTVRVEVLTNGEKELFASPGERTFSERNPIMYGSVGLLGDGLFGMYLKSILVTGNVGNQYKGEEEIGGRRLARYDYRLPVMFSGQTIRMAEGSGTVGLRGSYWADPRTYDVVRLEVNAEDIPLALPIATMGTTIDYALTRLSDSLVVLLPVSAEMRMEKYSGEISRNRVEFTHCRVFGAESSIVFAGAESLPFAAVTTADDSLRPLPDGMQIAIKLRTPILAGMAVGTLIEGQVESRVTAKGLEIAAGASVRGRIRRLEHYTDPLPHFVVGLEFTELEIQGIRHRFYADLVAIGPAIGVTRTLSGPQVTDFRGMAVTQTRETVSLPNLPGVATFFVEGTSLDLPQGFRTVWKTRSVAPDLGRR